MADFVNSLLSLMLYPFSFVDIPLISVPFGFGVFVMLFSLIKRLGGYRRV